MNYIRTFISLLIVALIIIAIYGMFWWETPPAPIADYELGARIILAALVWTGPDPAGHGG